ncbi:MAG TPA: hypothetical protein VMT64_05070, partial [Candidatus Binataceae bacterium]|nr:hypothetical protein [Candidatus Binataceae bacterium]
VDSGTGERKCDEQSLGGSFSTAADRSNSSTSPQFIALNSSETEAYVTDSDIGRLKTFDLINTSQCVAVDSSGNCTTAVKPFIRGNFRSALFGKRTGLSNPIGVAVSSTSAGDEVFLTNFKTNSILEFGPGVALSGGNVPPLAVVKGGRTKLNEPFGIAITPPQMIP